MNDRFKFRTYIPDLKFFKYWGWIEENHYVGLCPSGDYSMPELLEKYTNQCTGLKDKNEKKLTDKEFQEMVKIAGDLMLFLAHKVTCGSFTSSESRKIYKCIEDLKMDYEINPEYHGQGSFNVLERLKNMFYHSWKNRRKVIFE